MQKIITLELTLEDVNKLLQGLGELLAKESIDLIGKIQMQAQAQLAEEKEEGAE